jgi:hypothetical protein
MENQHRKIKGYRELSAEEIDLMNRIKAKGLELMALQLEVARRVAEQVHEANAQPHMEAEAERLNAAEPRRWASIAKTDIQTGVMALVRAIAQPAGV